MTDQLRLWQNDLQRVQTSDAYVYDNFESPELHAGALAYATRMGWLLWQPAPGVPNQMTFAIRDAGAAGMKRM